MALPIAHGVPLVGFGTEGGGGSSSSGGIEDIFAVERFADFSVDAATLAMIAGFFPPGATFVFPDTSGVDAPTPGIYTTDGATFELTEALFDGSHIGDQVYVTIEWLPDMLGGSEAGPITYVITSGGGLVPVGEAIGYDGSGVFALKRTQADALDGVEGHIDNNRIVRDIFMNPIVAPFDLATLKSGPVADIDQPIGDGGEQIQRGDLVATLGDMDPLTGNSWIHAVHPTTGQWGDMSTGAADPPEAALWDNALATNFASSLSTAWALSNRLAFFASWRTDINGDPIPGSIIRGGPDVFGSNFAGGIWVVIGS